MTNVLLLCFLMSIINFVSSRRDLYVLWRDGKNEQGWVSLADVPDQWLGEARVARRIQVTNEQYEVLVKELVK